MTESGRPRLTAAMRHDSRVSPLELFFDLVFVLALTQCTALMADVPTIEGVAQAMLVLSALWWSWIGYSWLTSVVDPEDGLVRLFVFVAMGAFLVAALCVPGAFGDAGLTFALAYGAVRVLHVALFVMASRDDAALRSSVVGLGVSTALSVSVLLGASQADDRTQAVLWAVALALDLGGPAFFGAEGWKLVPEHFAERYGLIVLIALGESIVAIGSGVELSEGGGLDGGIVVAALVGTALVAALWWLYFDIVAVVAARRLEQATVGREQNEIARDSFSFLHLPMVAGIVLVALGMKKTLADVGEPLKDVPAAALLGGTALYLLAHVAFRWRTVHRLSWHRLSVAVLLLGALPVGTRVDALVTLSAVTALLTALVVYETLRFAELRAMLAEHDH